MELSEGMVAVVRGMQDSALCVSLLDGARQYTLLPNPAVQTKVSCAQTQKTGVQECTERVQCDTSTQAVDGRYASVYQMSHCHVLPTSPQELLTEFPPQRAELCPGHGNFEVGGLGSGERHCSPTRVPGTFRGGLSWPDRGSVCSPRPLPGPDAFANSLRKYPSLSPDRSMDMVERIINYTQKNSKTSRFTSRSDCCSQSYERVSRSRPEQETRYPEESPTRDRKEDFGRACGRSFDVRYMREASRKVKDTLRNFSTYPYNNPVCPAISERYDHLPAKPPELNITSSVNMETQAAIPMVSREVTTIPRVQPTVRNVAVSSVPLSSCNFPKSEETLSYHSSKSIQTSKALDMTLRIRKSAQTCFSSADLLEKKKIKNKRQSKSQEELRINDEFEEDIVQLIEELTSCPDLDRDNAMQSILIRKLKKNNKINRNQRVRIKIGRCIKDKMYSEIDLKNFTRELSNELVSKIRQHNIYIGNNPTNVYRADIHSFKMDQKENCVDEVIKEWLNDIPIKTVDYLGRDIKKGYLLRTVGSKIKCLILNKLEYQSNNSMKADIIDVIEDIPINISGFSKRFYINQLATELIKKIKDVITPARKRWRQASEYTDKSQSTEKELKLFVRSEIAEFIQKFKLKVSPEIVKQIETELIDIFVDSIEIISGGNTEDVKEDIFVMLADCYEISEHQAVYFANNVMYNFKDVFTQSSSTKSPRSQTFIVLQNSIQNTKETDGREPGTSLDLYTNQIAQEISEWTKNITSFDNIDAGFKIVVINDLAGDIVDRHKYLELNSSKINTDDDELEHLKYQIFKWMSKIVGEENLDIIDHASQLMERIKSIPTPVIKKPPNTETVSCCQKDIPDTSKFRRKSNPSPSPQQKTGDFNMKTRRQSSPGALTIQENPNNVNPNHFDITTASQFNRSIEVTSTPKVKNCCQAGFTKQNNANEPVSAKQLNDDYDAYLKNWVQEIPITTSSPEEQALAEKARSGIYNGVWRVIAKLKMNPATVMNSVYYQDVFDDELEDLFSCLPQTPELTGKKHRMKAQLIEKTTETNDFLQRAAGPSTYKQQLVENITNNLPIRGVDIAGKDPNRIYEDFQKMNLAENYIMYMEYKTFNRAKANTFKKKLMREVQELINGLKAQHGKELKDIDHISYRDDVIAALQKVPLPSDETLQQEAEEIGIGLEVEEWFQDLPLISPEYPEDMLAQRSFRDTLTKKIYEIEKESNLLTADERDNMLKEEIRRFLARMPLIPGENKNINYMIEELINRLKNKPVDFVALGGVKRKSVNFGEGYDYDEFSRNMPVCSSFSNGQPAQVNQSSIFIKDGNRVDPEEYYGQQFVQDRRTPESQQQWDTLQESGNLRRIDVNPQIPLLFGQLSQKDPSPRSEQINPNPQSEQWLSLEEVRVPPGFWDSNAHSAKSEGPPCCQNQIGDLTLQSHVGTSNQQPVSNTSSSQTPALSLHGQIQPKDSEYHDPSQSDSHRLEQSQRFQPSQRFETGQQQFYQSPQSCCQSSQQHNQNSHRYEENSQNFAQDPQQHEPSFQQFDQRAQSPQRIDKRPQIIEGSHQFGPRPQQYDPNPQQFNHRPRRYHQSPPRYDQSPQRIDGSQRFNQVPQEFDQAHQQFNQDQRPKPDVGFEGQSRCASYKSRRSSAPPGYKTEGSTHRVGPTPETQYPCSNAGISGEPVGFSTPEQHGPLPSIPRKRNKVRRRLDLEGTDDEIVEERCRCMEKFYRRSKKMYAPYDDEEYVPCFMGYRRPCYY